jgi:lipopolysaccharide assembly outer membrane protein LptD (OstA)
LPVESLITTKVLNILFKKYILYPLLSIVLFVSITPVVYAQDTIVGADTSKTNTDTLNIKPKTSALALDEKVVYSSVDSIRFNVPQQKVYLYGKAKINYEDIELKADYIEIDFNKNQVFAKGLPDSTGTIIGKPVFLQGAQSFSSTSMTYNFKTKKGLISDIITKEGDSYLHGNIVKKYPDNTINIRNGQYTTCSLEHPHYEIKFSKAKVIPDDKIITGPAYLVIEDVPVPLGVPFGFFPNKKGQKNGILIPTYGEQENRGFFLENGGYYTSLGPRMDLALRGAIYSRGSWAVNAASNYNVRYKMNGNFKVRYATNIFGEKGVEGYQKNKDFFVNWTHNQDPKARPNSKFSASVNAGSSKYNKFNPSNANDYLSNTFTSNITYYTTIGSAFNFSANLRHSQNTITHRLDVSLPEIALTSKRFYPFRSSVKVGKAKWYDNISLSYTMNTRNTLSGIDSVLFKDLNNTLRNMKNGMQHSIPLSSSINVMKYFTLTNAINYTERWYLQTIQKQWYNTVTDDGSDTAYVKIDTISGFKTERDFSFSSTLNTRIYGMYQFKNFKIAAIRHVMTPSVSFSYLPDFSNYKWGYYKYYMPSTKATEPLKYSIFDQGIYGTAPSAESGRVTFALSNNLEMKIRSKKDTITGLKKVVILENFTIATSYDLAKDSLNWSKVSLSGRTKLFKNLDLRYVALLDPYIIDSAGNNLNQFEWTVNRRLLRSTSSEWAFSLDWNLRPKTEQKPKTSQNATEEEMKMINSNRDAYIDYDIPWSLNIYYTFRYTNTYNTTTAVFDKKVVQTLSFNGDMSITPKWRIGLSSGYDFDGNKFTYTSVDINRDMHCWEMIFKWIPIGFQKSYNVTIRVKSTVLQDLKLTKKKDALDK